MALICWDGFWKWLSIGRTSDNEVKHSFLFIYPSDGCNYVHGVFLEERSKTKYPSCVWLHVEICFSNFFHHRIFLSLVLWQLNGSNLALALRKQLLEWLTQPWEERVWTVFVDSDLSNLQPRSAQTMQASSGECQRDMAVWQGTAVTISPQT